jgi:SAM-dependent methyltransferase
VGADWRSCTSWFVLLERGFYFGRSRCDGSPDLGQGSLCSRFWISGCGQMDKVKTAGVTHKWVNRDREMVSRRYDLMARYIALFDRLPFVPPNIRCTAVERLGLSRGDRVLEIGCGTGNAFPFLQRAIGLRGKIYGVDISPRMLEKAKERCNANN